MPYFGEGGAQVVVTDVAAVNTINILRTMAVQNAVMVTGFIVLTGNYAAGGFSDSMVGLPLGTTKGPDFVMFQPTGGFILSWDRATQKIKVYRQSAATGALTEIANAAFPAGLLSVQVSFFAVFSKFS